MLIILLVACTPKAPPVYWADIPPAASPPEVAIEQREDECAIEDLIVGEPMPAGVLTSDATVACYGHVLPTWKALELTYSEDLADYWEERATLCHAYRSADRATCEAAYQSTWQEAVASRRRGAALEVGVGVAFVVGVALGAIAAQTPTLISQ